MDMGQFLDRLKNYSSLSMCNPDTFYNGMIKNTGLPDLFALKSSWTEPVEVCCKEVIKDTSSLIRSLEPLQVCDLTQEYGQSMNYGNEYYSFGPFTKVMQIFEKETECASIFNKTVGQEVHLALGTLLGLAGVKSIISGYNYKDRLIGACELAMGVGLTYFSSDLCTSFHPKEALALHVVVAIAALSYFESSKHDSIFSSVNRIVEVLRAAERAAERAVVGAFQRVVNAA